MAGSSPVTASEEQNAALETLAASKDRGEADRARAMLLTLKVGPARGLPRCFVCARTRFASGGVSLHAVAWKR